MNEMRAFDVSSIAKALQMYEHPDSISTTKWLGSEAVVARRRAKNGGGLAGFGIVAVIALIASVPKEVWIFVGVVSILVFIAWKVLGSQKSSSPSASEFIPKIERTSGGPISSAKVTTTSLASSASTAPRDRLIPSPPPSELTRAKWLTTNDTFDLAGLHIAGGMVYVGLNLVATNGRQEPALINPNLRVSNQAVDISVRRTQYWPSYSEIEPEARRAYLQWLASGRRDPVADIGYVFLFFYGLERRVLMDLDLKSGSDTELPLIRREVEELLSVYGSNFSFRFYASSFLNFITAASCIGPTELGDPPNDPRSYELPLGIRLGLAKIALANMPVPTVWARKWALADPTINCRTPVRRCTVQFEKLFEIKYREAFGEGLVLPINRTKLKISYRPASGGFAGITPTVDIGNFPDIAAITGPQKKLQSVVDGCTIELEKYSRFIAKNEERKETLEAALLLPTSIWPDTLTSGLRDTETEIEAGDTVATWGGLLKRFGCESTLPRPACISLASRLEEHGIGIEPDYIAGSKTPMMSDPVVVFSCPKRNEKLINSAAYSAAALMIDVGAMMAAADGDVAENEFNLLKNTIQSWNQLDDHCKRRLAARLQLQITKPPAVAAIRKRLDMLSPDARRTVADVLVAVARADGVISPDEVKLLEKLYKLLQLDPKLVYSDLHGGSTPTGPDKKSGFALDSARIAKLQEETAKISSLLEEVFTEEESTPTAASIEEIETDGAGQFLGLDLEHSNFARLLLSRSQWTRGELADAASDMELMLDGALERINEAALDKTDMPLTEGEDPVEINREVLEKALA